MPERTVMVVSHRATNRLPPPPTSGEFGFELADTDGPVPETTCAVVVDGIGGLEAKDLDWAETVIATGAPAIIFVSARDAAPRDGARPGSSDVERRLLSRWGVTARPVPLPAGARARGRVPGVLAFYPVDWKPDIETPGFHPVGVKDAESVTIACLPDAMRLEHDPRVVRTRGLEAVAVGRALPGDGLPGPPDDDDIQDLIDRGADAIDHPDAITVMLLLEGPARAFAR